MNKKLPTANRLRLRELLPSEMGLMYPLMKLNKPSLNRKLFEHCLRDMLPLGYHAVAAFDGDTIIGISGFWLRTRFWCGRQLDIDNFFVHPDHRARGIGKKLVAWLEKRAIAEKCQLMVLDTYADYFLAQRFYHREGFSATGTHFTKVPGSNVPFSRG